MLTFLSGEHRKMALRGYRERLVLVYLGVAAATAFMASALLLPTYFLVSAKRDALLVAEASPITDKTKADSKAIETEVRALKEKLSYARAGAGAVSVSSILERLGSRREPGISLTSVSIKRGTDRGSISIGGKAATRDALVAFSKSLQGEPSFSSVNLPVSSLAKSKDIPFSITIDSKI